MTSSIAWRRNLIFVSTPCTPTALSEFYISEEAELLHIPKHMTYEEAASLGTAATTAWTSLYAHSPKLRPGQTVLCMGTGGVSLFAAQVGIA